jgi:uncharacterized Zn finger protein
MPSVADLVEPTALETLATPATLRLGREIAEQGGVETIEFGPLKVRANVGKVASAETRRTTELRADGKTLDWSCTCTGKPDNFCKHCAALAIVTWEKAPKRGR